MDYHAEINHVLHGSASQLNLGRIQPLLCSSGGKTNFFIDEAAFPEYHFCCAGFGFALEISEYER
jgi:hypothetical protein